MERFFNTAGPIRPTRHYHIPPLSRINLNEVVRFIEEEKYFVLHAPRQTGKSTVLEALAKHLNQGGEHACVYANIEAAQAVREDLAQGMWIVMNTIASAAHEQLDDSRLASWIADIRTQEPPGRSVLQLLKTWSAQTNLPVVLLLDEVDSLVGDTLISLLRQLRTGYGQRPRHFPQSVVLCGVRDVRDYRMHSSVGKTVITGGSAFNIKAKSLRLGNFSRAEVADLYRQHTEATGQDFEDGVVDQVWRLTGGQPWLVNALAYETCFDHEAQRNRTVTITSEMLEAAKEVLILRRDTHLDQLLDRLEEPRVRRVIEPMLTGTDVAFQPHTDDVQYAIDLGLVERRHGTLEVANPIYREVIPRELTDSVQLSFGGEFRTPPYVRADGSLDANKLLSDFQVFFREHSESWLRRFLYEEAGPQLLLMAFLQRILNGGGRVEREYALGRRRTDLLIQWPKDRQQGFRGPVQKVVVELKILHAALDTTVSEALPQTAAYLDRTGADEGHILVIDKTQTRPWNEKIFTRQETFQGRTYTVWGM